MKINTIINKAGSNSVTGTDSINVYIYSDTLNQLFTCGSY